MTNFEEQLAELERVVEQLERGELALEQSVQLFERGMVLSEACKKQLAEAESRIQVLLNPRERGPVKLEDLALEDESDTAESLSELKLGAERAVAG